MKDFGSERPQGVVYGIAARPRRGDGAALAKPFHAKFGIGRKRLHMAHARRGNLGWTRQKIVGEGRREGLARRIKVHFFVKRGADALSEAAVNLPVHHHRIDELAAILNDDVVENLNVAGLGVDRDSRNMSGITESARVASRLITNRGL